MGKESFGWKAKRKETTRKTKTYVGANINWIVEKEDWVV
jgi:hypothetical protein